MRKSGFSIALFVLTLAIGIGGASWIFANGIKRPVNNLPELADSGHQNLPKAEEPDAPVFEFPVEPVMAPRPQPPSVEDQASSINPKPEPVPPKEQPRRPGPTPTTPKNSPPETEPTSIEELRKAMEALEQLTGKSVEFTLTVSGVVVDEFGAPASGAEVFARLEQKNPADAGGSGRPARRMDMGSLVDTKSGVAIATADQAGRFTATFTRRVGEETTITVCLKARGENWLEDGETRHEARSGDNLAGLTLKVKAAATLSGRVVDGSGIGIEMASVFLTHAVPNTPSDRSRVDDLRRRVSSSSLFNLKASTDAGGNFVIKGVPEGEYAVNVTRAGFQQTGDQRPQVTVTSGQTVTLPAPIVLGQSATVRVSVSVDDGTKLTALRGEFMKEASGHQKAYSISLTVSADKDGTFTFPHLPAGNYTVIFNRNNRMYKPSDPIPLVVNDGQATDLGVINIYKDPDAKPYPKRGPGPYKSGDNGGGGGEKEVPEAG